MSMYEILIIVIVVTMCLMGLMIVFTACKRELQPRETTFLDLLEKLSKNQDNEEE